MKLTELVSEAQLAAMVAQGYVSVRTHPTLPLAIYNYSKAAQWDGVWNPVTLACRGLIVNMDTGEVVARPLAKFFTWGQSECPDLPLDAIVHVADKADGSLGILYPDGDGWAIATRGLFASDQAVHATEVLRSKYPHFTPVNGYTYLFEIVYPENRVVVDYGDTDDLILLGYVEITTGEFIPAAPNHETWYGPKAQSFGYMTVGAALAMPARVGAEGIVLHRPETGDMVKVKQSDYIALHRIMTDLTARTLWEHLAVNDVHSTIGDVRKTASRLHMDPVRVQQVLDVGPDWMSDYVADALPDEFHQWVRDVIDDLLSRKAGLDRSFRKQFQQLQAVSPTRKDFAELVKDRRDKGILFALYQGQDIGPVLWSLIYPAADKPFEQSEEVA